MNTKRYLMINNHCSVFYHLYARLVCSYKKTIPLYECTKESAPSFAHDLLFSAYLLSSLIFLMY